MPYCLVGLLCNNIRLMICTWFHCWVLIFDCHGRLCSRKYLCYQPPHKSLGPRDSKSLPWAETFQTCPYASLLERKHILCGLRWGRALEAFAWSLWTLKMYIFFPDAFSLYPLLPKILLKLLLGLVRFPWVKHYPRPCNQKVVEIEFKLRKPDFQACSLNHHVLPPYSWHIC